MGSGLVVIVSADKRWLRVLEVTIRLGGAQTITRRSLVEAFVASENESQHPTAVVVDLGAQTSEAELDEVCDLVRIDTLPTVVILPERLVAERERFASIGASVLVRPYRPSELFAALWPGEAVGPGAAGNDEPVTVDPGSADAPPGRDDAIGSDGSASTR